jgi:hypothetical protein
MPELLTTTPRHRPWTAARTIGALAVAGLVGALMAPFIHTFGVAAANKRLKSPKIANTSTTKSAVAKPTPTADDRKQFPSLIVTDVASGRPVSISALEGGKPTLFWFWAPS